MRITDRKGNQIDATGTVDIFLPRMPDDVIAVNVYRETRRFEYNEPKAVWRLMHHMGTNASACGRSVPHWELLGTVKK